MFTRHLMADEKSLKLYDRVLTRLFSLDFMGKKRGHRLFRVHSETEWAAIQQQEFTAPIDKFDDFNNGNFAEHIFTDTFKLEGYTYDDICCVQSGDIVLDCGAYIGDTALYFCEKMQRNGKVFCFEPSPEIFEKLQRNIKVLSLADNAIPINRGLSNNEGKLTFSHNEHMMGASRILSDGEIEVDVTTIDRFVEEMNLNCVNFIKMDIEGAECDALRGGMNTIKHHRPKMAISIYHKISDFWEIPKIILSFDPNYKFYLKHNSVGHKETVLFCVPVNKTDMVKPAPINVKRIAEIGKLYKATHAKLLKNASDTNKQNTSGGTEKRRPILRSGASRLKQFVIRKIRKTRGDTNA